MIIPDEFSIPNPFLVDAPILYPLKTENLRFSCVFRGYKMGTQVRNELILTKAWMFVEYIIQNFLRLKNIPVRLYLKFSVSFLYREIENHIFHFFQKKKVSRKGHCEKSKLIYWFFIILHDFVDQYIFTH